MNSFVKLTCTEISKDGMLCKFDTRFKATDIQVIVAAELTVGLDMIPITYVWLPNGTRVSVSETITEVERRINEALQPEKGEAQ